MVSKIIINRCINLDSYSQSYLLFVFMLYQLFSIATCKGQYTHPTNFNEKGIKTLTLNLERITSFNDNKDVSLYGFKIGYGTYITKRLALNGILDFITLHGKYVTENNSGIQILKANTSAIGVSVLLRWYTLHMNTVSLFIDANAGFLFSFKSFPVYGTKLNLTARPGIGMAIGLSKTAQLLLGANRFHLSNGQGYNHPINPGYDGLGLFMGIVFLSMR